MSRLLLSLIGLLALVGCSKQFILDGKVKAVTCIYSIEFENGAEKVGSFRCPPCESDDQLDCFKNLPENAGSALRPPLP